MTPTVSICLPVYNGERHLPEAIESVLAQSFDDFELIVNDDLSDDTSRDIITRYAREDSRVIVLSNQCRLGLFQNYNSTFAAAKGRIIKPFAQDDRLYEDCLRHLVELLDRYPSASLATVDRDWIDADSACASHKYKTPSVSDYFGSAELIEGSAVINKSLVPVVNMIGEPVCVAFRRTQAGIGFDPAFHHLGDLDFWLRLLEDGALAYSPEVLASYRRHEAAQTEINRVEMRIATDVLRIRRKFAAALAACESNDRFMPEAIKLIAGDLYRLGQEAVEHGPNNGLGDPEDLIFAGAKHSVRNLDREDLEEICIDSLRLVGQLIHGRGNPWGWSRHGQRSVERLEMRLNAMLRDPFWRLTRPAREVRKLLTVPARVSESGKATVTSKPSTQSEYTLLLRDQIGVVRRSRTWRLRQRIRRTPFRHLLPNKTIETNFEDRDEYVPLRLKDGFTTQVSSLPPEECIEEVLSDYKLKAHAKSSKRISVVFAQEAMVSTNVLNALSNQTLEKDKYEVIFVNARGSKSGVDFDNVGNLPLRAFKTKVGGRAFAHNFAARIADGDILIFLASDFVPPPEFLQKHLEFHERRGNQRRVAIGGNAFAPDLRGSSFRRWLDESGTLFGVSFTRKPVHVPDTFFYVGNSSIRKEVLLSVGMFDEEFPSDAWDDFEYAQRLDKAGVRCAYLQGADCMHEHPVTLLERLSKMSEAAQSALILERKYEGTFPWKELTLRTRKSLLATVARALTSYALTRNPEARSLFYNAACDAAFALAYHWQSERRN